MLWLHPFFYVFLYVFSAYLTCYGAVTEQAFVYTFWTFCGKLYIEVALEIYSNKVFADLVLTLMV